MNFLTLPNSRWQKICHSCANGALQGSYFSGNHWLFQAGRGTDVASGIRIVVEVADSVTA